MNQLAKNGNFALFMKSSQYLRQHSVVRNDQVTNRNVNAVNYAKIARCKAEDQEDAGVESYYT